MARSIRTIPQKTLSLEDRATFERMVHTIQSQVGVHINKQPPHFITDTRIHLDLNRFPVARPTQSRVAWGGYFTYSPTYTALSPEQRWNYIAWLAGDESLGIQLFRVMRLYALCAEFSTERRTEAIAALRKLYHASSNDALAQVSIGNVLTLAYAANQPAELANWLGEFQPTQAIPTDVLARCYAMANIEASGTMLFDVAVRCSFKLGRGLGNKRPAIEQTMEEIAQRWSARTSTTVIKHVLDQTPTVPIVMNYQDTLVMWVARVFDLSQGVYLFDRSEAGAFMRGLAAAAQEQVRSQKKGSTPLDGLELLDGILNGDGNIVQFDLSGSADYSMSHAEQAELQRKLEAIKKVVGVKIVKNEWDVYSYWSGRANFSPESVIIQSLPIKTPTSPEPWNAPAPPSYSAAAYKTLTPEQRWRYLDWLAGSEIKPLDVFLAVRFKGLEASFAKLTVEKAQQHVAMWLPERKAKLHDINIIAHVESIFEQSNDESLQRAALDLLLPLYAAYQESDRATLAFNRTPVNPDQAGRMLAALWEAGGTLEGRGLLYVARVGGFNHTPLTRECFDPIAERAQELLNEWELDNGMISELPIVSYGGGRWRKHQQTAVAVAAEIARQAQEEIKAQRRNAPRTSRMSAEEIAAEQVELAELPANTGDVASDAMYQSIVADKTLVSTFIHYATNALERNEPAVAVAFLRRAVELDPHSHATKLLPLARMHLAEQQGNQ